jgi:aldehyde dehydrogenase (NAD+)
MSLTTSGILNPRTSSESPLQVRGRLKNAFKTGRTKDIRFRRQQLLFVSYLIKDNIALFQRALASDLGRSDMETFL